MFFFIIVFVFVESVVDFFFVDFVFLFFVFFIFVFKVGFLDLKYVFYIGFGWFIGIVFGFGEVYLYVFIFICGVWGIIFDGYFCNIGGFFVFGVLFMLFGIKYFFNVFFFNL